MKKNAIIICIVVFLLSLISFHSLVLVNKRIPTAEASYLGDLSSICYMLHTDIDSGDTDWGGFVDCVVDAY